MAGYDVGSAAGLYAGSQTISASMGLATDAINRLGLTPEETKSAARRHAGRLCRHLHLRHDRLGHHSCLIGPALLGIDLEAACKRYEEKHGGKKESGGPGTAWYQFGLRAFRVRDGRTGRRQRRRRKPRRCFPSSGSSCSAFAVADRSWTATADTVIQAAISSPWPAAARCW